MIEFVLTKEEKFKYFINKYTTQKKLGEKLGISQPAVSKKLKDMSFDYRELCIIFESLPISKVEIGEFFVEL